MPIDPWTGQHYLKTCPCGSGKRADALYDARSIFLTFTCEKCKEEKLKYYRADVLTDASYWHDEPIDEE